jgi:protein-S-isoprenylcysteine O-methyltransferase Ste14
MNMNQNTDSKLGSVLAFVLAVLGLVYLILNRFLLAENPIGIGIQVLSVALMIWARFTFGIRSFHAVANTTEGRLVTNGPYRWWRHPIYAAVIYFAWAGVSSHLVMDAIAADVLITVSLFVRMLLEEKFLRATYPEYSAYAKRAKRLVPFLF